MQDQYLKIAIQYAEDVISGKKPNCNYTKKACELFLAALRNPCYYYNADKANEVIEFIQMLELSDDFIGEPYVIYDWLYLIICSVYGIYSKETQKRVYSRANITVPRKNSKSQFVSALAIYHLIYDEQQEILLAANAKKQVKEVNYEKIVNYAKQLDPKGKRIIQYYDFFKYKKSKIIALASDSKTIDGKNCGVAILDETENFKDSKVYDVIVSSTGARKKSTLIWTIGTAGDNINCYGYQLYEYSTKVLTGEISDPAFFTIIFGLDQDDEWNTLEAAEKANPMYNYISSLPPFFAGELVKANNDKIFAHGYKIKNLNIYQQDQTVFETFIEDAKIVELSQHLEMPMHKEVYLAFDLGSRSDITALTIMWLENNKIYFLNRYYLPEDNKDIVDNKLKYTRWAADGHIVLTPGNCTDYDYVRNDIEEIARNNEVLLLSHDEWNATQLVIQLQQLGLYAVPVPLGNVKINAPTKELYRLAMLNNIVLDDNPVTRWMWSNAIVKVTGEENIRLAKAKYQNKIDGCYSVIMCLSGWMNQPTYGANAW